MKGIYIIDWKDYKDIERVKKEKRHNDEIIPLVGEDNLPSAGTSLDATVNDVLDHQLSSQKKIQNNNALRTPVDKDGRFYFQMGY